MFTVYGTQAPHLLRASDEATQAERWGLEESLRDMAEQVNQLHMAVQLFGFCYHNARQASAQKNEKMADAFMSWQFIAARDGAIRITDFLVALEGANKRLKDMKLDVEKIRPTAFDLFKLHFPDHEAVRNGAAHTTLAKKTDAHYNEHAFTGSHDANGISVSGEKNFVTGLFNGHYTTTWRNKIVSYLVSPETVKRLDEVKTAFFQTIPTAIVDPRT